MRVSFVYPMYNEVEGIGEVVRLTNRIGERVLEAYEIIVVNDASTDGSGEIAEALRPFHPRLRVLHHDKNIGLGGSLRTGFAAATMEHVLYMDSDMPVAFPDVEAALRALPGNLDMAAGYRIGRAESWYREVQSTGYRWLLCAVFGLRVRDVNFAFKLFRRELVSSEPPQSRGSFIDAELLLESRRRGYDIRQIGFRYHHRTSGTSTIGGPRVIPKLLSEMMQYRRERGTGSRQPRQVIFNADDFGLCRSVNEAVRTTHERGVVRAASIMAGGAAFEEAAQYAREHPALDIGVHLTLCDATPVCEPAKIPTLMGKGGRLAPNHRHFSLRYAAGKIAMTEIALELEAQIDRVAGAGLAISHLDSHQHLHAFPGIFRLVIALAAARGIRAVRLPYETPRFAPWRPLRSMQSWQLATVAARAGKNAGHPAVAVPDFFLGMWEAGRWDARRLARAVSQLRGGTTEICVHPSVASQPGERSWGNTSESEVAALIDPGLAERLAGQHIAVTNFRERFG